MKKLFGLIYMSSYKIQLDIVNLKNLNVVEKLDSPSFIQSDSKFGVYEESLTKICSALEGFRTKLEEYKIKNYKFYANRQLLDSDLARFVEDQIRVRTGFKLSWLNSSQVIYNKVLAGMFSLNKQNQIIENSYTYLLSLGSAMMNLSLFNKGKFMWTWSIALGPKELQEINKLTSETAGNPIDVMSDYIGAKLQYLKRQFVKSDKATLIIQHAPALNNRFVASDDKPVQITKKQFYDFFKQTVNMSNDFLVDQLQVEQSELAHVLPNMVFIKQMFQLLDPNEIYLTNRSVITGLLVQEKFQTKGQKANFDQVVMTSVQNMARRYLVDLKHANAVKDFALHIFDRMKRLNLLNIGDRKLLEVTSVVNEVGNFISSDNQYKHSSYILDAKKIIGLSDQENEMIAQISGYNLDDDMQSQLSHYNPEMQLNIAKIASILRLAEALDASHKQKIKQIVVSIKENTMIVKAFTNDDITLERWSFKQNIRLFEKVFGMKVKFVQKRGKN